MVILAFYSSLYTPFNILLDPNFCTIRLIAISVYYDDIATHVCEWFTVNNIWSRSITFLKFLVCFSYILCSRFVLNYSKVVAYIILCFHQTSPHNPCIWQEYF